jgi:hypothetical protein
MMMMMMMRKDTSLTLVMAGVAAVAAGVLSCLRGPTSPAQLLLRTLLAVEGNERCNLIMKRTCIEFQFYLCEKEGRKEAMCDAVHHKSLLT